MSCNYYILFFSKHSLYSVEGCIVWWLTSNISAFHDTMIASYLLRFSYTIKYSRVKILADLGGILVSVLKSDDCIIAFTISLGAGAYSIFWLCYCEHYSKDTWNHEYICITIVAMVLKSCILRPQSHDKSKAILTVDTGWQEAVWCCFSCSAVWFFLNYPLLKFDSWSYNAYWGVNSVYKFKWLVYY